MLYRLRIFLFIQNGCFEFFNSSLLHVFIKIYFQDFMEYNNIYILSCKYLLSLYCIFLPGFREHISASAYLLEHLNGMVESCQ